MGGRLVLLLGLWGVSFFSVCLFFSSGVSLFWLFLELVGLSLIPLFFLFEGGPSYSSLFDYILISSISSSLVVCGLICESLTYFVMLGFLIKFGVFPFMGWVYSVILGSNWLVIWCFSTLMKSPFILLSYFLQNGFSIFLVCLLCSVSFLYLSFVFWVYSFSWIHCWCHMMLSSSAGFIYVGLFLSVSDLYMLFLIYLSWASLVTLFLSTQRVYMGLFDVWSVYLFCFLLIAFPGSLSIFYKLYFGGCVFSCFFFVGACWVIYSVSEQAFLVKWLIGPGVPVDQGSSVLS